MKNNQSKRNQKTTKMKRRRMKKTKMLCNNRTMKQSVNNRRDNNRNKIYQKKFNYKPKTARNLPNKVKQAFPLPRPIDYIDQLDYIYL